MKISHAVRRKLIQIAAFGFSNIHVANFATGRIYKGPWKNFCNPGLNCYSCPAATLSCPIGALCAVNGSPHFPFSLYVTGFILMVGVLFGRLICAFICPFGLVQELIAKIPLKKHRLPMAFRYVKYAVLLIFVILIPLAVTDAAGNGVPAFCKFICPEGTLFGGVLLALASEPIRDALGGLFFLKLCILFGVIAGCMFVHRFFCKVLCPLGAIYGILNHVSIIHMRRRPEACISCGKCASVCPMDVDPVKTPDSAECIRCGICIHSCPEKALSLGLRMKD